MFRRTPATLLSKASGDPLWIEKAPANAGQPTDSNQPAPSTRSEAGRQGDVEHLAQLFCSRKPEKLVSIIGAQIHIA